MSNLKERALQFQMLQLPGQPQAMHMGTAYLVNDLMAEIERLTTALQDAHDNIAPANADHAEIKARIRAALEGE